MLKVNVERGEIINAEAVNLGDIVFVACDRTGGNGAGKRDVLYIPMESASVFSIDCWTGTNLLTVRGNSRILLLPSLLLCRLP